MQFQLATVVLLQGMKLTGGDPIGLYASAASSEKGDHVLDEGVGNLGGEFYGCRLVGARVRNCDPERSTTNVLEDADQMLRRELVRTATLRCGSILPQDFGLP